MAIATLTVDLAAKLARFESDMGRVVHLAEKAGAKIDGTFAKLNTGLKATLGGIVAGVSFAALNAQVEKAVGDLSRLDDAAARTGASVESLSGIFDVADIGGHDLALAEQSMIKLAKAISDAKDDASPAAAAFKALRLNVKDLNQTDTGQAFVQLAQHLDKFGDGIKKTAALQELLGKSGAQAIPLLQDLAEAGKLNASATAEQAAAAEAYEKAINRLHLNTRLFVRHIVADALPAMVAFAQSLNDAHDASAGLARDNAPAEWATGTAKAFAVVVDVFDGVRKSFQVVGISIAAVIRDIHLANQAIGLLNPAKLIGGGMAEFQQAVRERNAFVTEANKDIERILSTPSFSQRLDQRLAINAAVVQPVGRPRPQVGDIDKGGAARAADDLEKQRNENLARIAKQAEEELAALTKAQQEYAQAVHAILGPLDDQAARLEEQVQTYGKTDAQVNAFIASQLEEARVIAELNGALPEHIDLLQRAADARRRIAEASDQLEVARFVGGGETAKLEAVREEMQRMAAALERGEMTQQQFVEGATARLGLVGQVAEKTKSIAEELGLTFESAFEAAIVGGKAASDVIRALEQDILHLLARKLVTEPLAKSLTGLIDTGGDTLAKLFKSIVPSFDVGTPYVPRDTLAFVHQGERIVPAAQARAEDAGGRRSGRSQRQLLRLEFAPEMMRARVSDVLDDYFASLTP